VAWNLAPRGRLLADVSLWSADLANLQNAVERLSPYADSFHLDVADAHFAPDLLFFPGLVAALRPHTTRPFHVHLIVEEPSRLVDRFAAAGADLITMHCEVGDAEVRRALDRIQAAHKSSGMALGLDTPVAAIEPYVGSLAAVILMGTEIGVKGGSLAPEAPSRIAELDQRLQRLGLRSSVLIVADGGIRRETVPLLREAGVDAIVPGSLVFQAADLAGVFDWVHAVPRTS